MTEYERRSNIILKKWDKQAERRKAAEDKLPVTTPESRGHEAYVNYKTNVDALRAEGII